MSTPHFGDQLWTALKELVEAIKRGEEVNTSHWAYLRAEALIDVTSS